MLRAGVDVVPAQPQPRHDRRAPRPPGDGPRAWRPALGRPIGVLADLPGPKLRAGPFPDGGVDLPPAATSHLVPGPGRAPARVRHASTTRRCSTTSTPATASCSATAASPCACVVERRRAAVLAEVQSGGRTQGRPGVHLSCERLQMFAPTAQDLVLAEAVARRRRRLHRAVVRRAAPPTSRRLARGRRRPRRHRRQDRDGRRRSRELAEITAAADAVMVARGDLGIDCPLEDVPHLQKQIIRHCVERRHAGDHGDADAGDR